MSEFLQAIMMCVNCRTRFMACPDCVCTIRIDPETGLPPDSMWEGGRLVHNPNPSPEATARAVKQPACDECVSSRNETYLKGGPEAAHIDGVWELWEQRHRRTHT